MSSDHYTTLPRKRVHVAVLVFNKNNELLILKPTYKDNWSLPGGVVEKDESPQAACARELNEETGLSVDNPVFLAVQYLTDSERGDALFFMFDGGVTDESIMRTQFVANEEIQEWKFVPVTQVADFVTEGIMTRIQAGLSAKESSSAIYCER